MTPLKQAKESARSILWVAALSNARVGKVVLVSQLAPVLAARPSLNLKAGVAYAVGQGWIRDWGRAVVLTEKGLAASAALVERQGEPPPNAPEEDQGKDTRFMDSAGSAGATAAIAGFSRAFRSIVIPPRPAVKKPTVSRR
jgi:hypothetical protein